MKLLVVLLGSNPLPVYVTIKAIQNEEKIGFDKVLFVFSSKTRKYVTKIKDQAGLTQEMIEYCDLEDSHREPQVIREKIVKTLTDVLPQDGSYSHIHFNHTGGTKTMAIHGYIAISDFATKHNIPFSISDLDSDIHKLNVNIMSDRRFFRLPENKNYLECEECSIDFKGLVKLHGFEEKKTGTAEISKPSWCISLDDMFKEMLPGENNKSFPHNEFHKLWSGLKYDIRIKNNKSLLNYINKEKGITTDEEILKFCYLDSISHLFDKSESWISDNLYDICDFVHGKWLEYLVFSIVKKLIDDKQINVDDALMSEVVFLGDQKANRDCELDVVIMNGYQLTLISCTTAPSISIVKQKAFEAIFRANQLGGEQARILLVSMLNIHKLEKNHANNLETLRQDLDSFELNQKVELAGKEHLQKSLYPDPGLTNLEDIIKQLFS